MIIQSDIHFLNNILIYKFQINFISINNFLCYLFKQMKKQRQRQSNTKQFDNPQYQEQQKQNKGLSKHKRVRYANTQNLAFQKPKLLSVRSAQFIKQSSQQHSIKNVKCSLVETQIRNRKATHQPYQQLKQKLQLQPKDKNNKKRKSKQQLNLKNNIIPQNLTQHQQQSTLKVIKQKQSKAIKKNAIDTDGNIKIKSYCLKKKRKSNIQPCSSFVFGRHSALLSNYSCIKTQRNLMKSSGNMSNKKSSYKKLQSPKNPRKNKISKQQFQRFYSHQKNKQVQIRRQNGYENIETIKYRIRTLGKNATQTKEKQNGHQKIRSNDINRIAVLNLLSQFIEENRQSKRLFGLTIQIFDKYNQTYISKYHSMKQLTIVCFACLRLASQFLNMKKIKQFQNSFKIIYQRQQNAIYKKVNEPIQNNIKQPQIYSLFRPERKYDCQQCPETIVFEQQCEKSYQKILTSIDPKIQQYNIFEVLSDTLFLWQNCKQKKIIFCYQNDMKKRYSKKKFHSIICQLLQLTIVSSSQWIKINKLELVLATIYLTIRIIVEYQDPEVNIKKLDLIRIYEQYRNALKQSTNIVFIDKTGINQHFSDFFRQLNKNISDILTAVSLVGTNLRYSSFVDFSYDNFKARSQSEQQSFYIRNSHLYQNL